MDNFVRLLLRFILVPLGYFVAVMAGALVILVRLMEDSGSVLLSANPDDQAIAVLRLRVRGAGFVCRAAQLDVAAGSIGILISEAFAIRSWMFHACNGAVSAWIGWSMFGCRRPVAVCRSTSRWQ